MLDLTAREMLFGRPLALDWRAAAGTLLAFAGASPLRLDAANAAPVEPSVVAPGIAIIEAYGLLSQRAGMALCTGYDAIRASLCAAYRDPAVKAIALMLDSQGGEIGGNFDLADAIYAARGQKPVWAICAETATAGAYALASAADRVTVPRSGHVGAIGILLLACDMTGALDQAGVKMHLFSFGKRKADGNPFVQMAPEARASLQAEVDTLGGMFVNLVARNRGRKASEIRAQQARSYMGAAGVEAHLADAVRSPLDALAELAELVRRRQAGRVAGRPSMPQSARRAAVPAMRPIAASPAARAVPAQPAPAASWDRVMRKIRGA